MKKIISFLTLFFLICTGAGCGTANGQTDNSLYSSPTSFSVQDSDSGMDSSTNSDPNSGASAETLLPYDVYDLDAYLIPIWNTKTVYNETLLFVGKEDVAPLLRTATEIVSVRSYDLKTEYVEGKDYIFKDNCLKRTENGSIPFFDEYEYYPIIPQPNSYFLCTNPNHPYILFGEGDTFCSRQISVTYKTREKWRGNIPENQKEYFPELLRRLNGGETTKIVFYGDSITVGANSSSFIGVEPNAASWPQMVTDWLNKKFGNTVTAVNAAVGGTNTQWGIDNVSSLVTEESPDLAIVGFGMNDVGWTAEEHEAKMRELVTKIRSENPKTEILLVSSMLANKEVGIHEHVPKFEQRLVKIGADCKIGVAKVTTMHEWILQYKRYYDMTGNNVNHPNDFLARIYAQTVLKALMGEIYDS